MSETLQETVKWFSAQKGYGFITGEDGIDYFALLFGDPDGWIPEIKRRSAGPF